MECREGKGGAGISDEFYQLPPALRSRASDGEFACFDKHGDSSQGLAGMMFEQ